MNEKETIKIQKIGGHMDRIWWLIGSVKIRGE